MKAWRPWMLPLVVTAGLATAAAPTVSAQIPEKFTNLQLLPKETSREQLVQTMRSFANALGVRCSHGHANTSPEDFRPSTSPPTTRRPSAWRGR